MHAQFESRAVAGPAGTRRRPRRALLLAGAVATGGCWLALGPRLRAWGATAAEVRQTLPGDDLVPRPRLATTRAITVQAPVGQVWPWIVQLGQGRGGLYSYDWLENRLGLGMQSADEIHPEWQGLAVGDLVHLAPGSAMAFRVETLLPEQALVLGARVDSTTGCSFSASDPLPAAYFRVSWAFVLVVVDAETSRLIVRMRLDWNPSLANTILWRGITEPAHFIMERQMLHGIRQRAQGQVWEWLAPAAIR